MARTLYGDDGVTDANGDDANEGIMRRVSGNGCGKQEKTGFSNNHNGGGDDQQHGVADDDGGAFVLTSL